MHGSINPPSPSTAAIGGPLGKGNFAPIEVLYDVVLHAENGPATSGLRITLQDDWVDDPFVAGGQAFINMPKPLSPPLEGEARLRRRVKT